MMGRDINFITHWHRLTILLFGSCNCVSFNVDYMFYFSIFVQYQFVLCNIGNTLHTPPGRIGHIEKPMG